NPKFMVGTTALAPEPASDCGLTLARPAEPAQKSETSVRYDHYTTGGVIARPEWTGANDFNGKVNITLSLKGSKSLQFIPSGKTTTVRLGGSWSSPSFDGDFIPINRSVDDSTFTATWKVSHFNRPFSQQWIGKQQQLGSSFGVNLLIPVDQYQKSMRTAKYGIMIILLTFIAMFMVEIIRKIRIHPFQYILIGAALIVYYTLLLSLSEHFGYNLSYAIASASTIILISLYSSTFLHSGKLTLLFTLILSVFYGFIFVIIQEQDYSLLLGSVGLFIIIATLMFFSRNIDWYTPRTGTAKR
ncbi:MAG TPA: cell envelope integrity protein CreD, partial [Chryseosolibacter sp.]|nr:cell envelope integrity protein CreD [Chryseosolibacter sp.]